MPAASARDNSRASTSAGPYQAFHGRRSAAGEAADAAAAEEAESRDGNRLVDLCQPALAATITRDAERLCAQQVSREVVLLVLLYEYLVGCSASTTFLACVHVCFFKPACPLKF